MSNPIDSLEVSTGVKYLTKGYVDYADEVIAERAMPNMYDGLKPVNRKLLWTFYQDPTIKGTVGKFIKSKTIAGNTLGYHPHDDIAVYKASVAMTDSNQFCQVPMLMGRGNLGNTSSGESPAAPRYTEEALSEYSQEMFGELDGIQMMPNYDNTKTEPTVLPVSFPLVLCQPAEGIAVGFGCKIPSFNFNDVLDLTIEYLRDGDFSSVIMPDFMTKGYYVQNNVELTKLMRVGKAALKLRGEVVVVGKEIMIKEVPFGRSIIALEKQIKDLNHQNIKSVSNLCDSKHGICLSVLCSSQAAVDDVLYALYKSTDLQYTFHANMTLVLNGSPRTMGVYDIIREWVDWRKGVVKKHLENQADGIKSRARECRAFLQLIDRPEVKDEFVMKMAQEGSKVASAWLREQFTEEEIPDDLIKFVASRTLNTYHTGGKYRQEFENVQAELNSLDSAIEDLNQTLITQLEALKARYGAKMVRQTQITNKDYEFIREEEGEKLDTSTVWYTLKDNFLKKLMYDDDGDYEYKFQASASDVLIAIDSRGQILRIHGKDLALNAPTEMGVYIPRLLEMTDADDIQIKWLGVMDGSTRMLLYKDGYVGFLDTSEFLNSRRQIRVMTNGVHKEAHCIGKVFEEIPEALLVTDSDGRMSFSYTKDINRKSRTARTKVFSVKKGKELSACMGVSALELSTIVTGHLEAYSAPSMKYLVSDNDYTNGVRDFETMM